VHCWTASYPDDCAYFEHSKLIPPSSPSLAGLCYIMNEQSLPLFSKKLEASLFKKYRFNNGGVGDNNNNNNNNNDGEGNGN
jgi:hypothetical protein